MIRTVLKESPWFPIGYAVPAVAWRPGEWGVRGEGGGARNGTGAGVGGWGRVDKQGHSRRPSITGQLVTSPPSSREDRDH